MTPGIEFGYTGDGFLCLFNCILGVHLGRGYQYAALIRPTAFLTKVNADGTKDFREGEANFWAEYYIVGFSVVFELFRTDWNVDLSYVNKTYWIEFDGLSETLRTEQLGIGGKMFFD